MQQNAQQRQKDVGKKQKHSVQRRRRRIDTRESGQDGIRSVVRTQEEKGLSRRVPKNVGWMKRRQSAQQQRQLGLLLSRRKRGLELY